LPLDPRIMCMNATGPFGLIIGTTSLGMVSTKDGPFNFIIHRAPPDIQPPLLNFKPSFGPSPLSFLPEPGFNNWINFYNSSVLPGARYLYFTSASFATLSTVTVSVNSLPPNGLHLNSSSVLWPIALTIGQNIVVVNST